MERQKYEQGRLCCVLLAAKCQAMNELEELRASYYYYYLLL
jgi:hypothetical protein